METKTRDPKSSHGIGDEGPQDALDLTWQTQLSAISFREDNMFFASDPTSEYQQLVAEYNQRNYDPPFSEERNSLCKRIFRCFIAKRVLFPEQVAELNKLRGLSNTHFSWEDSLHALSVTLLLKKLDMPEALNRMSDPVHGLTVFLIQNAGFLTTLKKDHGCTSLLFLVLFLLCYPEKGQTIATISREQSLPLLEASQSITEVLMTMAANSKLDDCLLKNSPVIDSCLYMFAGCLHEWVEAYTRDPTAATVFTIVKTKLEEEPSRLMRSSLQFR